MIKATTIHFGSPLKKVKVFLHAGTGMPLVDLKLLGAALNWTFLDHFGRLNGDYDLHRHELRHVQAERHHFADYLKPGQELIPKHAKRITVTLSGLVGIGPRGESIAAKSRRDDIADLIFQIRRAMDEGEFIETPTPVDDGGPDVGRFESCKD